MRDADIPLIPSLCSAIITACDEAKAVQAQFRAERGLTLEQARDLSEKE